MKTLTAFLAIGAFAVAFAVATNASACMGAKSVTAQSQAPATIVDGTGAAPITPVPETKTGG